MKTKSYFKSSMVLGGVLGTLLAAKSATAQSDATPQSSSAAPAPSPSGSASPQLPYGVADVLKLVHARVNDDTTIAFIQSNRSQYGLGASEILYLKDQGVSDRVLTAMLEKGKNSDNALATASPTPQATAGYNAQAPITYSPPVVKYASPVPTYVESVPAEAPVSTVYVIPNPQPGYVYYGSYPFYGGWCGYHYPPVSFGFGYPGCYPGGGFRSYGFRGAGIRGGGFNGTRFASATFHGSSSFGHRR